MDSEIHGMLNRLSDRVLELEKRMDLVFEKLGIENAPIVKEPDCSQDPKLVEAIKKGDMLEAIRIYREITHTDLATAKKEMESLWTKYQ